MVCRVKFITEIKCFDGTTMKKKINVIKERNHSSRNIVHVKNYCHWLSPGKESSFTSFFFSM